VSLSYFYVFVSPSSSPQNSRPNRNTASDPSASHRIFRPPFLVALILFSIGITVTSFFFNGKTLLKSRGLVRLKIVVARTATAILLAKQFTGNNNKQDDLKRKMPPWQRLSLDLQSQVFSQREAHSKV
jgi:hypothetical protein